MAHVILSSGPGYEVQPKNGMKFQLGELQEVVKGYIEVVNLSNGLLMIVNEEGKLHNLPCNDVATTLYQYSTGSNDVIVGDVILLKGHEID